MTQQQSSLLLRKQLRGKFLFLDITIKDVFYHEELMQHPVEGFSAGLVDDSNVYNVPWVPYSEHLNEIILLVASDDYGPAWYIIVRSSDLFVDRLISSCL